MGAHDDTYVSNPVLAVQEPKSPSTTKMTLSDGRGRVDGSGPSSPPSRRHQEQVEMDVPMAPKDNLINETEAPIKAPDITLVASITSNHGDPTPSDRSGGGNGSGTSFPRSLTQEEQVKNLKENYRHTLEGIFSEAEWAQFEGNPWFAEVVAELRTSPCLENFIVKTEGVPTPSLLRGASLLHMAVLMGDLQMVQEILESRLAPNDLYSDSKIEYLSRHSPTWYSALDLAIMCGESEIVDALLQKNAKVNISVNGSLHFAVVHARAGRMGNHCKIIQSLVNKGIDIGAKQRDYSAFYLAVALEKTDIVKEFSKWKDKINLNEACGGGRPPIQIANEEGFKDIEIALMQCEDVRRYIDEAFRDRQAYVDAANAILVGAALIASVTFASWLQPPLNYTTSYHDGSMKYVDVEHNSALGSFWVFNTLSFYFAIGTVVFGAHSVLPRRQLFITETVKKLSQNLLLTSILLAFSVLFVIVAFGIVGFIVLIPILRYRWYMIAPTILGGLVCVGSIGYLFKSLWKIRPGNIRNRKRNARESDFIKLLYDRT